MAHVEVDGLNRIVYRVISSLLQLVTAFVAAGRLDFNPEKDTLTGADGKKFKLASPTGAELPSKGFDSGVDTYQVGTCGG